MDTNKNFVVTINRELGTGGRTIGKKLAERLGVNFYDKVAISSLVEHFHLSVDEIENIKAKKSHWWDNISAFYMDRYRVDNAMILADKVTTEQMFQVESEVIRSIADNESCVIAGRSAFCILKDHPNCFKILIESSMETRVVRLVKRQNVTEDQALETIKKVDEGRENYTKKFAGTSRYDARNYDLVLNVSHLSEEQAVDVIYSVLKL